MKKTKIICTIGPASCQKKVLVLNSCSEIVCPFGHNSSIMGPLFAKYTIGKGNSTWVSSNIFDISYGCGCRNRNFRQRF